MDLVSCHMPRQTQPRRPFFSGATIAQAQHRPMCVLPKTVERLGGSETKTETDLS